MLIENENRLSQVFVKQSGVVAGSTLQSYAGSKNP